MPVNILPPLPMLFFHMKLIVKNGCRKSKIGYGMEELSKLSKLVSNTPSIILPLMLLSVLSLITPTTRIGWTMLNIAKKATG